MVNNSKISNIMSCDATCFEIKIGSKVVEWGREEEGRGGKGGGGY